MAAPTPEVSPAAKPELQALTGLFEEPQVDWLDEVRVLGLTARPKVDVSRSAVLRLAVARLQEQMSPQDVVAWFTDQLPDPAPSVGRKRR